MLLPPAAALHVLLLPLQLVGDAEGAAGGDVQPELLLEVVQLLHEVEVGCDVRLALADQVEGVVQVQAALVHEVGDCDGHGTRDAGEAVHQDALLAGTGLVCNQCGLFSGGI